MTENYYRNRTGNYKADHSTYGGEISLSDFEGYTSMALAASKIYKTKAFDRHCKLCSEARDRQVNYRNSRQRGCALLDQ